MSAPPLYQQLVLDHSRAPRRFGELAGHTHAADGSNPLCGDTLHVELHVADARIVGYAFRGEACAVARASASMLGDRLDSAEIAALDRIEAALREVVEGGRVHDAAARHRTRGAVRPRIGHDREARRWPTTLIRTIP